MAQRSTDRQHKVTVIAIDGTFSSGKGTLARRLGAHYQLPVLDTGKLYRATAYLAMQAGGDVNNEAEGVAAAAKITPELLTDPILKSGPVGAAASKVSVHPGVRGALFDYQRDFAARGAILDGRDIGTVICPDADVKLYIDADPAERARRRHLELSGYGEDITYEEVLAQLKERDHRDMNRDQAPLKPAADAHLIDTTNLSIERAFEAAVKIIDAVLTVKTG